MEKHKLFKSDAQRIAADMVKYAGMHPCPAKKGEKPKVNLVKLASKSKPCPEPRFPPCTAEQTAARMARALARADAAEAKRLKALQELNDSYVEEDVGPQKPCPPPVFKIGSRGYRAGRPYSGTGGTNPYSTA